MQQLGLKGLVGRLVQLSIGALLSCTMVAAERTPNIVIILADDFGYGSAGCYGADPALVRTPNIDRLAREGRRFTDANTTSSVCSPTRYSLLTGRYCWRTSLKHEVLSTFAPLHIEKGRLNLASMLKRHGYGTAAVGKWHLGYGTATDAPQWRTDYTAELSPGPLDIGFDYHFSVPSNHGDVTGVFVENQFVYGLRSGKIPPGMKVPGPVPDSNDYKASYTPDDMENPKGGARILDLDAPRRKNERVMKVLTDKSTAWLQRQTKDRPFFLYFTPVAVHNPVTPDKDLAGQSKAGFYGDWIHELDRSVGRVLETLDQMGVAKDTLVIFTSDNGGVFKPENDRQLQTAAFKAGLRVNGALRGGKHDVWEGGFKVPFIVRWPGKASPGSVCREMVSLADLLATTAAVVGEPLPPATKAAEDSRNILPAILGEPTKPLRDDLIVHSAPGVFALRKGPWKWIEGVPVDEIKPAARKTQADQFRAQLYNTQADPGETKDVSAQQPEVVKELRDLLNRYRNGGYSRELPPEVAVKEVPVAALQAAPGTLALNEPLGQLPGKPWVVTGGKWVAHDGAVWGAEQPTDRNGATLRTPCSVGDGTIDLELNLDGANRISIRIEAGEPGQTFRVVISRTAVEMARNPVRGETQAESLARKPLELQKGRWYPVRLSFVGNNLAVQVNDTQVRASHPIFGNPKTALNFLVFGDSAGFKNVAVRK